MQSQHVRRLPPCTATKCSNSVPCVAIFVSVNVLQPNYADIWAELCMQSHEAPHIRYVVAVPMHCMVETL